MLSIAALHTRNLKVSQFWSLKATVRQKRKKAMENQSDFLGVVGDDGLEPPTSSV